MSRVRECATRVLLGVLTSSSSIHHHPSETSHIDLEEVAMRSKTEHRSWVSRAIQIIEADFNRSSDTHLLRVPLPGALEIALYVKDESTHPPAASNTGWPGRCFSTGCATAGLAETPIIEASSGSTAVSEAYFAQMLGLRFIAVMPRSTSPEKIAAITFYGGESHFVDSAAEMYAESARLAASLGGHYMDQFTYAERATDWRGNNNIAESIFSQMAHEEHPIPTWIVVGAGTGGTSATLGATSAIVACQLACALLILKRPYFIGIAPTGASAPPQSRPP